MEGTQLWNSGPTLLEAAHIRLTTDSILLADFTKVKVGERGADLGCASGVLMLLLLWREKSLRMTGVEVQTETAALAMENLRRNGLSDRADILCADYRNCVKTLSGGAFDFVIANPPYFASGHGLTSPNPRKAAVREEIASSLGELCSTAAKLCRSGGRVSFSFRAERTAELLRQMSDARLEPKRLRFVHHSPDKEASIVLAEGRRDGRPGLVVEAPLVLHEADGTESGEYRRIYHRN